MATGGTGGPGPLGFGEGCGRFPGWGIL
uniref:Uncharacterized protein n=1 Tax=Arundo donax TaxID=35708 RepID=A0A0A9CBN1_ARUDO